MVRLARGCLAWLRIGLPQVVRSRERMRHDGGDTLKSQDYHAGLRGLPLKAMECAKNQSWKNNGLSVSEIRGKIVGYIAGSGGGSGVHPSWSYSSKTHSA